MSKAFLYLKKFRKSKEEEDVLYRHVKMNLCQKKK